MKKLFSNSIFRKVFIKVFFSFFAVLAVFILQASSLQKKAILDSLYSQSKSISSGLKFFNKDAMILNNDVDIFKFSYDFVQANNQINALMISRKNQSSILIKQNSWKIEDENIYRKYENKAESFKLLKKKGVFHYTYPVYLSTVCWGWIHLDLSLHEYNKKVITMYLNFLYLTIFLLCICVLVSYFIAKIFTKPIIELNNVSQKIAQGDMSLRVDIKSNDEIGSLANSFNKMVKNLYYSQNELKNSNINLENSVNNRTKQLQNANIQLEEKTEQLSQFNKTLAEKIIEEVSKNREKDKMMLQQSKMAALGELLGMIAHQWRQPLSQINSTTMTMYGRFREGTFTIDTLRDDISEIEDTTNFLSQTISDFSAFYSPDKEKTSFSTKLAVDECLHILFPKSSYKMDIQVEVVEDTNIKGYITQYQQAILAILINALDMFEERHIQKPMIKISVESYKNKSKLIISDNAQGIDEKNLEKVFEAHFSTKKSKKNCGLGLYISKAIIEQNMDGEIYVENNKNGAMFTIVI